jgi:cyclic lactone autoinducer peptide
MRNFFKRSIFQGLAAVLGIIATTNIGTTSMFMMYQPVPPKRC